MTADDPVMIRLNEIAVHAATVDREDARRQYEQLWTQLGEDGDPLHLMTLLHHLADLYEDPARALEWDQRALVAADRLTDERLDAYHPGLRRAAMYPSLHLNIADNLTKLGRVTEADEQLVSAEQYLDQLDDGGYGAMIRGGIAKMRERITVQPPKAALSDLVPIGEFLAHEASSDVRSELLEEMGRRQTGRRVFTFNCFDVIVDDDAKSVTVDDVLDIERSATVSFSAFSALLQHSD